MALVRFLIGNHIIIWNNHSKTHINDEYSLDIANRGQGCAQGVKTWSNGTISKNRNYRIVMANKISCFQNYGQEFVR